MNAPTELLTAFRDSFVRALDEEMGVEDFLHHCKGDRMAYASAHECVLEAIGKPKLVNTADDARLSRIFQNRVIQTWDVFADFHGMEETLMSLYAYFLHAAQGLEEKKQVLYLLGPVGGGKSSLAEKIKSLCELFPIYTLKDTVSRQDLPAARVAIGTVSSRQVRRADGRPVRHSAPSTDRHRQPVGAEAPEGIQGRFISKFSVVRIMPSVLNQVGIVKTEPGDENTQDISSLVGKVDLRMLEQFAQDDHGRLQLLGRALSGFGALYRVRRDVQGAA